MWGHLGQTDQIETGAHHLISFSTTSICYLALSCDQVHRWQQKQIDPPPLPCKVLTWCYNNHIFVEAI